MKYNKKKHLDQAELQLYRIWRKVHTSLGRKKRPKYQTDFDEFGFTRTLIEGATQRVSNNKYYQIDSNVLDFEISERNTLLEVAKLLKMNNAFIYKEWNSWSRKKKESINRLEQMNCIYKTVNPSLILVDPLTVRMGSESSVIACTLDRFLRIRKLTKDLHVVLKMNKNEIRVNPFAYFSLDD